MRKFKKIRMSVLLAGVFIFMMSCRGGAEENLAEQGSAFLAGESLAEESLPEENDAESRAEIFVYVCGAVRTPGVYALPAGSRVYEAVELAGGLTEEADERAVNQAEVLKDGMQVTVPTRTEAEELRAAEGNAYGRVNINTAGVSELTRLTGIGEARAKDIIAYREAHGAFSSPEEIMKVSGIKEAVYEKIKDDITVG